MPDMTDAMVVASVARAVFQRRSVLRPFERTDARGRRYVALLAAEYGIPKPWGSAENRRLTIVRLRAAGVTYAKIGQQIGVTPGRVRQLWLSAARYLIRARLEVVDAQGGERVSRALPTLQVGFALLATVAA